MATNRETEKLIVGLAQFNIGLSWSRPRKSDAKRPANQAASYFGQPNSYSILPYSAGLLQSYTQKYARQPERYEFLLPLYKRVPVQQAVEHLQRADVVGFSAYVWNIRLSLETARRLKEINPGMVIVFGGPQTPDHAEAFLRENPFIDIVCHGEGERVFLAILEALPPLRDAWQNIPAVSYLAADGTFINHPNAPRISNLNAIPSPYLDNVFLPLMQANPSEKWVLLWETNRGCPFSCSFCDWGSATTSKVYQFETQRIMQEIGWFGEHQIEFVICCDANFGILPRDLDIAQAVVASKNQAGYPRSFSIQNTKNATERAYKIQTLLNRAMNTIGVTISLQSLDPHVLQSIKRANISSASFQELQRRYTRDRIYTYTDMIIGLPDETYQSFKYGISQVIQNGQHNHVQFHNCSVLPNAEMGNPAYQKQYGMQTVKQRISNVHGSLYETAAEEIPEYLDLVITTAAMPAQDWIQTKVFAWMSDLLHFDHVLQIPFVVLHEQYGLDYGELIESVIQADPSKYPILADIHAMLAAKAGEIQNGGMEYFPSETYLNIWWPADQYALIRAVTEGHLEDFYHEVEGVLSDLLSRRAAGVAFDPILLHEAIELNRNLLKAPFQRWDVDLYLSHNVWEFYQSVLAGTPVPLEERHCRNHIERHNKVWLSYEDWCEHLIWCQNKEKSAYLYDNKPLDRPATVLVGPMASLVG